MRYLKKFNEAIEPDEIKDFCEMYLAYLLDDGYALTFNESSRVTQINFVKPNTDVEHIGYSWMNWDQIKDSFIPFLKVLDKQYDIKDNLIFFQIRAAAQIKMSFQDVIDDKVKEKIFSVTKGYKNHDYEHATVISSITIPVLDHSVGQYSWQLRESRNIKKVFEDFKEDLEDFAEDHLAYLIDDGFSVKTTDSHLYGSGYTKIRIELEELLNSEHDKDFTWDQIEDKFVPFIYMLNRDYSISEIKFFYEGSRSVKFDNDKDIKELLSGAADKYLTSGSFYLITIMVKK